MTQPMEIQYQNQSNYYLQIHQNLKSYRGLKVPFKTQILHQSDRFLANKSTGDFNVRSNHEAASI